MLGDNLEIFRDSGFMDGALAVIARGDVLPHQAVEEIAKLEARAERCIDDTTVRRELDGSAADVVKRETVTYEAARSLGRISALRCMQVLPQAKPRQVS